MEQTKNKSRAERISNKEKYSNKQNKIAQQYHIKPLGKHCSNSATTCGSSTCAMCGNPRKFNNEPTIQEKRMFQDVD